MNALTPLLLLLLAATACAKEPQTPTVAGFAWREFSQAVVEASASKKMILVDVYTDW